MYPIVLRAQRELEALLGICFTPRHVLSIPYDFFVFEIFFFIFLVTLAQPAFTFKFVPRNFKKWKMDPNHRKMSIQNTKFILSYYDKGSISTCFRHWEVPIRSVDHLYRVTIPSKTILPLYYNHKISKSENESQSSKNVEKIWKNMFSYHDQVSIPVHVPGACFGQWEVPIGP